MCPNSNQTPTANPSVCPCIYLPGSGSQQALVCTLVFLAPLVTAAARTTWVQNGSLGQSQVESLSKPPVGPLGPLLSPLSQSTVTIVCV